MSYDIYCYRSKLGKPDEDEANQVIEADGDKWAKKNKDAKTKLAIVKALIAYNPRLEAFDFHYGEIAKLSAATIEEEKNKFDHIELNTPENDPAVQLIVYDNHVAITVPYLYQGNEANQLFKDLKSYIKTIRETAGYFVYDPQTGQVYDPVEHNFDGLAKYLSESEDMDEILNDKQIVKQNKKPWWKFW